MNFLFQLRNFKLSQELLFQLYTIQSVICSSITVGFGPATKQDRNRLQLAVRTAEKIIGSHLPSILHLCRSHHRSITPWRQPIPTSLLWLALQNTVGQNMQTQEQFFTQTITVMNSQSHSVTKTLTPEHPLTSIIDYILAPLLASHAHIHLFLSHSPFYSLLLFVQLCCPCAELLCLCLCQQ